MALYKLSDSKMINENEITQLIKVDDKYYVVLSSGEKMSISEQDYNTLKAR